MPKVSIVLPTYNGEKFLRQSIDSILSQTYTDWELIIVDDCSTDSTSQIADEYSKSDNRIKVIHNNQNNKLPVSLNIGFNNSNGELLTWTSDDNIYLPEALEKMVKYLENNKDKMMVCSMMNFISEENKYISTSMEYSDEYMYYSNCVGACFLYRSEVINEVGEYDPDFFLVEDYDYWLRILIKYKSIGYIKEILYLYRIHPKSLTTTKQYKVQYNKSKLREKYIYEISQSLKHKKELLLRIYFEIEKYDIINEKVENIFSEFLSEYFRMFDNRLSNNIIVYGAGEIGKNFYNRYKKSVKFFSDRDINKVGQKIDNIGIISLEEMKKKKNDYQIVIAVGMDKVTDLINTLTEIEIDRCFIYKDDWN